MNTVIHICSFSGSVGRLKRTDRKDNDKVLAALKSDPRISVWDFECSPTLRRTIKSLLDDGLIERTNEPYPYYGFLVKVTP